jgi:flagellar biosynthesis/type III secretory pathway M-ring protein FliF/YscJ
MEDEKKGEPGQEMDALLDALGADGADAMLAELLKGEPDAQPEVATKPREIRARLKEIAGKHPELIVKIINHWITEDRRRK